MNKLNNIPCWNGIPLLSEPLLNDIASLPRSKEKHNLNKSVMKKGKAATLNELYKIPCFNAIYLLSAPPIDERA